MHDTVILIPYYKREAALRQTLRSIADEDSGFDVVIVDDGSPQLLYINANDFNFHIHMITMPQNGGITTALNAGLSYILSKNYNFIARIDAGDFWVKGRIAAQREFLQQHPDYSFVGCCTRLVYSDRSFAYDWDLPLSDQAVRRFMYFNNAMFHPAVMMRAETVRRAGLYSEQFPAAEDYEYFRRLLKYGKAANLPGRYLDCEIGVPGESISVDNHKRQIKSVIRTQLHYFDVLEWRAYAGLAYKIMHYFLPGLTQWLKHQWRGSIPSGKSDD